MADRPAGDLERWRWRALSAALDSPPYRLLVVLAGTLVVSAGSMLVWRAETLLLLGCATALAILLLGFRFDYLHPAVAFAAPWLVVLGLSTVPISAYARPLEFFTGEFLLSVVFVWLISTIVPSVVTPRLERTKANPQILRLSLPDIGNLRLGAGVFVAFAIFYGFATFNVIHAGYIPLISLVTTGDSRYFQFGIHSVYGAFLAYANAVGCLAFYLYQRTHRRRYMTLFLSVLCVHFLFVTRQNIITLLMEALVIRCIVYKKFSRMSVIVLMLAGLTAFSALGNLRTGGGIERIIKVRQEYSRVPSGVIWLYAYSYFNVLNLENMMTHSNAPLYDGSMWAGLLPSVLRPKAHHESYLEISAMNVSSYIFPVYFDIGAAGAILWTGIWGVLTSWSYRKALKRGRFVDVSTYACLYFCALFSFFVNLWLYLPVIFQLVFFRLIHMALFARGDDLPNIPSPLPAL